MTYEIVWLIVLIKLFISNHLIIRSCVLDNLIYNFIGINIFRAALSNSTVVVYDIPESEASCLAFHRTISGRDKACEFISFRATLSVKL